MRRGSIATLVCALASCSPALDWREVRDGAVVASFPCRPSRLERVVALGEVRAPMRLLSCTVQDTTFALGHVESADPAAVGPALAALRAAAAANLGAAGPAPSPWQPPGATPNANAGMVAIEGRLPDGTPLRLRSAFFAHGLDVWQASVVGAASFGTTVQPFFDGLRVAR